MATDLTAVVGGAPALADALRFSGRFAAVVDVHSTGDLRDLLASGKLGRSARDKVFLFSDMMPVNTEQTLPFLIARLVRMQAPVLVVAASPGGRALVQQCPGAGLLEGPIKLNQVLGALAGHQGMPALDPVATNVSIPLGLSDRLPEPAAAASAPAFATPAFAAPAPPASTPEPVNPFTQQGPKPADAPAAPADPTPANPFAAGPAPAFATPAFAAPAPPASTPEPVNPFTQQGPKPADAPAAPADPTPANPFAAGPAPAFGATPSEVTPVPEAPAAPASASPFTTPANPFATAPEAPAAPASTGPFTTPANPFATAPEAPAAPASTSPFTTAAPAPFAGSANPFETPAAPFATQPAPAARVGAPVMTRPQRRGYVVTIAAPKGGTGKSSMTLNLGAYLGLRLRTTGRNVCVIDANVQQADAGKYLNAYTPNVEGLLRDPQAIHPDRVTSHLVEVPHMNMSVLLGPATPEVANPQYFSGERYAQILEALRPNFDYILIDTPVAEVYHPLFRDFVLPKSDFIAVVATPNHTTLENTDAWLRVVTGPTHNQGMGFDPDHIGIILNRAEDDIGLDEEDVRRELAAWRFLAAVPETKEWKRCNNESVLVAPKNYHELNEAFSLVLQGATGEDLVTRGSALPPTTGRGLRSWFRGRR